jgi:hypothetical protein
LPPPPAPPPGAAALSSPKKLSRKEKLLAEKKIKVEAVQQEEDKLVQEAEDRDMAIMAKVMAETAVAAEAAAAIETKSVEQAEQAQRTLGLATEDGNAAEQTAKAYLPRQPSFAPGSYGHLPMVMMTQTADSTFFPQHDFEPSVVAEAALPESVTVKSFVKLQGATPAKVIATIELKFPKWAFAVNLSTTATKEIKRDIDDFKNLAEITRLDKIQAHEIKSVKVPSWASLKEGEKGQTAVENFLNQLVALAPHQPVGLNTAVSVTTKHAKATAAITDEDTRHALQAFFFMGDAAKKKKADIGRAALKDTMKQRRVCEDLLVRTFGKQQTLLQKVAKIFVDDKAGKLGDSPQDRTKIGDHVFKNHEPTKHLRKLRKQVRHRASRREYLYVNTRENMNIHRTTYM